MNIDLQKELDLLRDKLPRKLTATVLAMLIILYTATMPEITDLKIRLAAMICQSSIAVVGLYLHYRLELKNPTI